MNKPSRYAATGVGLAAAFGAGLYLGSYASAGQALAEETVVTTRSWVMLEVARAKGTDAAYRDALGEHLALLESRAGQWTELFTERVYATESLLTYARLASLAAKAGARSQAAGLLADARSFCPRAGFQTCNADSLVEFAEQIDRLDVLNLGRADTAR